MLSYVASAGVLQLMFTKDLTVNEKKWFDKLDNSTNAELSLAHLGESAAISKLTEYPSIANLFFGPISIPDKWIQKKALATLNRDVFKKRYINSLHAETDTEKSLLIVSGHRDMCRIIKERIDIAGYNGLIDSFRNSILSLKEYNCPSEWQTIHHHHRVKTAEVFIQDVIPGLLSGSCHCERQCA